MVLSTCTKGGSGKTVVAINLAEALSKRGHSVLLFDADLESSNFASIANIPDNVKVGLNYDTKTITPVRWRQMDVFSLSLLADRTQGTLLVGTEHQILLRSFIESIPSFDKYEYIVVDTPGGSSDILKFFVENFQDRIAGVVIVLHPATAVTDLKRSLEVIRYMEVKPIAVIQNMVSLNGSRMFGSVDLSQVVKQYGVPNYFELPLDAEMPNKISRGEPLLEPEVFDRVAALVVEEPAKSTVARVVKRMVSGVRESVVNNLLSVLTDIIRLSNKEIDIPEIKRRYGLDDSTTAKFRLMSDEYDQVLGEIYVEITDKIRVLSKPPRTFDYEVIVTPRGVAELILGYKKTANGPISVDPVDVWLMGDVRLRGGGSVVKALQVYHTVMGSTEILDALRSKYKPVLEVML
ncbi:MAG: P-loop NTPase [Thermoprotei archaeon]